MERPDDVVIVGSQQATGFQLSNSTSTNGDINYGSLINTNAPNINSLNGGNGNSNGQGGNIQNNNVNSNNEQQQQRPTHSYAMPGILHFLQHEWNRFEYERQQWEIDRAELMIKISFLQGERRGQESLKNNLIRRIKMLELALKQERVKYYRLKFGTEPNELKLPTSTSQSNNENNSDSNDTEATSFSIGSHPILNKDNSSLGAIKQGRQLLKNYLQEIGYTDTVIDIRSSRLRSLLGMGTSQNVTKFSNYNSSQQQNMTGGHTTNNNQELMDLNSSSGSSGGHQSDSVTNLMNGVNKQLLQLSSAKKFSSTTVGGISNSSQQQQNGMNPADVDKMMNLGGDDVEKPMLMMTGLEFNGGKVNSVKEASRRNYEDESKINGNGNAASDEPIDADTEDALNEFAFLSSEKSSLSINSDEVSSSSASDDWEVDKVQLNELTEQYKKERKSMSSRAAAKQQQLSISSQRPNRSALQAMIANLAENEAESSSAESRGDLSKMSSADIANKTSSGVPFANNPSLFLEDDLGVCLDSTLGELSRITVNNSISISGVSDEVIDAQRKVLTTKFSLRGHFDGVRCLAFHPTESALLTGSEDQTIKLWNLDKSSLNSKKTINTDLEPVYTFRRHIGPVLSLLVSPNGDYCISSGLDSKIFVWNMPNFETSDQYDQYNPNVFLKSLNGHTDSVWNMALCDNTLLTVSADSTLRVWNPFSIDDLDETATTSLSCLNEDKSEGVPTSVDFVNSENSKIVTSFGGSHHSLYDIETCKVITKFDFYDSRANTHCYKVLSHPSSATPSSSLIISAHEDKKIRFFDMNSGKLTYQMVAHQDACTDLAIDPTCLYLLSASHDCSIRLWNLGNKNCIQEITSHRKKYDESINCIAFHPTKSYIASGGADAIVKIYV